jgi:hypothetical protein
MVSLAQLHTAMEWNEMLSFSQPLPNSKAEQYKRNAARMLPSLNILSL